MGSAPSRSGSATTKTSVQKICIDQSNGVVQPRETPNGVRRNSSSLASTVTDRIRKSASSINSKSSLDKEKRVQSLQHQLDGSEKRRSEAEMFVKVLQREMGALEIRNSELVEELNWLKQQLGSFPSMLNSIDIQANGRRLTNASEDHVGAVEEVLKLRTKAKLDRDLYENLVNKLQQELKEQDSRWNRRLQLELQCRKQLEGVIQSKLGDSDFAHLKGLLASREQDEAKMEKEEGSGIRRNNSKEEGNVSFQRRPSTANSFAGTQSSVPLSLASSFSSMDSQPLCRNLLPQGGRMATPQDDDQQHPHRYKRANSAATSGYSNRFISSAHSLRRASSSHENQDGDDEFDINHLLDDDNEDENAPTQAHSLSNSHDSGISAVAIPTQSETATINSGTNNGDIKVKSANRRRLRPMMGVKQLNNVFTLSEKLEPQRVVDSPRASTASTPLHGARIINGNGRRKNSEVNVDSIRLGGEIGHREVASKLFQARDSASAPTFSAAPRLTARTSQIVQQPDDSDFPPSYLTEETDEEVDDILYNSLPPNSSIKKIKSGRVRQTQEKDPRLSAKSHDSGYLEGQTAYK